MKFVGHASACLLLLLFVSCGGGITDPPRGSEPNQPGPILEPSPTPQPPATTPVLDIDRNGIPAFVTAHYIDLHPIWRISKFRSGVGHDQSDDFESCRSMKHYLQPQSSVDWASIAIYAPASGTVVRMMDEWAGRQIHLVPDGFPAVTILLYHVATALKEGDRLTSGQRIGSHIGAQTMSDVAVAIQTPSGRKLVSYFDAMPDSLFAALQARGLTARTDAQITKEERDADPLACDGESFLHSGTLSNWINLN